MHAIFLCKSDLLRRGYPRFGSCLSVSVGPATSPSVRHRTITDLSFETVRRRTRSCCAHQCPRTMHSGKPKAVPGRPKAAGTRCATTYAGRYRRHDFVCHCHRSRWRRPSRRFAWRKMLGTAVTRRQCRMPAQRTSSGAAAARCSPAVPRSRRPLRASGPGIGCFSGPFHTALPCVWGGEISGCLHNVNP